MSNLSSKVSNTANQSSSKRPFRQGKAGLASMIMASGSILVLAQGNQVLAEDMVTPPTNSIPSTMITMTNETSEMPAEMTAMENHQPAMMSEPSDTTGSMMMSDMPENMSAQPSANSTTMATDTMTEPNVTSPKEVTSAVNQSLHEEISVPDKYVQKADSPGPFTAGVNQVIPFESFGGDGMLTRLLLKSSDDAPWSDNGSAMNPALLPLKNLSKGEYFYNLELDGPLKGKMDANLLNALKALTDQTITGNVRVYAAKNKMPDLSKVIASKMVSLQFHRANMMTDKTDKSMANQMAKPNMSKMDLTKKDEMSSKASMPNDGKMSAIKEQKPMTSNMMKPKQMSDKMAKGQSEMGKGKLPITGETNHSLLTGFGIATLLGALGLLLKGFLTKKANQ